VATGIAEQPAEKGSQIVSDGPPELAVAQRDHWQDTYRAHPEMYGSGRSEPAAYAAEVFKTHGVERVLELAAGHGRDTVYFAHQGFTVLATDFSDVAVAQVRRTAQAQGVSERVQATVHDLRKPLPVPTASVDAVFAHMALCMALSTKELHAIVDEVSRVLKPGGKFIYTVRHTGDAHYGAGQAHGDGIFECGGFAVHFFSRELVESLAAGWILEDVHAFEEGELPRRLWRVTAAKPVSVSQPA
jgi:SAM-dependent methyltransferase